MLIIISQDVTTGGFVDFFSKNGKVHTQYHQLNFNGINDDEIILVDLGASGRFQSRVSAKEFCEYLVKSGMPDKISSIYLYMSDIIDEKSLFSLANQVREYFKKQYNKEITVFYPTDVNFDYTLLVPPTVTKSKWEVYGINKSQILDKSKPISFDLLYSLSNKKLLWDGFDINEWFSKPEHISQDKAHSGYSSAIVRIS
jgi:hypothetical protein